MCEPDRVGTQRAVSSIHFFTDGTMTLTMRYVSSCLITFLILFCSFSAIAETLYVKPSSEITMRRGQGTDFKVIAVVRDGTAVELMNEQGEWAEVQLPNGKQGWVLRRFLSDMPPLGQQVDLLQQEKTALSQSVIALRQQLDDLTADKERLESERASCSAELEDITNKFLMLQEDTVDVVQTNEDLKQARSQLEILEEQMAGVQEENKRLGSNETLKWFLAGGGVLLVGWIIGLISRRSRKKRSSLL